jgi:hypothetical protein
MKTFLRVLLILLLALLVLKLLPLIFILGLGLFIAVVVVGALALGLAGALLGVAVGLVAVLSPIWVPALIVVGIIALLKRSTPAAA